MNLKEQIKVIGPSVPDALYRLINSNVRYAYLKTGRGIIGFEVNLTKNEPLNGFCLIALKKHNIHAFKSDLRDKPKLVLFPTIENMSDPEYGIRELYVRKCEFFDDTFSDFKVLDTGELGEVIRDLLPPIRRVNLPDFSGVDKDAILEEVERDRKTINLMSFLKIYLMSFLLKSLTMKVLKSRHLMMILWLRWKKSKLLLLLKHQLKDFGNVSLVH